MNKTSSLLPSSKIRLSHSIRVGALVGAFSLATISSGFSAFVTLPENTPEDPGVALGSGTSAISGTVIAAQDSIFNTATDFQGVLRSMVVDTGLGFDFYYQLVNTGTDLGFGTEMFRMKTIGGFDSSSLTVSFRSDFTGLDFGGFTNGPAGGFGAYTVGTKSIFSAGRDSGTLGSVGFDFSSSHFLFDSANVSAGETSMIAVVRTSAATFTPVTMAVNGFGTAQVSSFAPVPEPQAAVLIAAGGLLLIRRRTQRW